MPGFPGQAVQSVPDGFRPVSDFTGASGGLPVDSPEVEAKGVCVAVRGASNASMRVILDGDGDFICDVKGILRQGVRGGVGPPVRSGVDVDQSLAWREDLDRVSVASAQIRGRHVRLAIFSGCGVPWCRIESYGHVTGSRCPVVLDHQIGVATGYFGTGFETCRDNRAAAFSAIDLGGPKSEAGHDSGD